MKSTTKILEPYAKRILKECAEKGKYPGQRLAEKLTGYKGYGFDRWLKEMTGDENFGLHPTDPEPGSSSFWLIRQKIDDVFLELLHAVDAIADGERRKIEAEKELRLALFRYKEARKNGEPKIELCEVFEGG